MTFEILTVKATPELLQSLYGQVLTVTGFIVLMITSATAFWQYQNPLVLEVAFNHIRHMRTYKYC